jgi:hypothetical protein
MSSSAAETKRARCLVVGPGMEGIPSYAGDFVVTKRVVEALSQSFELEFMHLESVGWPRRLLNLARRDLPLELIRYDGAVNRKKLADAVAAHRPDMILLVHEGAFVLLDEVKKTGLPRLLFPHNVHSQIARTDPLWLSRAFLAPSMRFERRRCSDPGAALVCISKADRSALKAIGVRTDEARVAAPGMPPLAPLSPDAVLSTQVVLTGYYSWWRKLRSLKLFAKSPGEIGSPLLVVDETVQTLLGAEARLGQPKEVMTGQTVQFGLITDYFSGGFKLKSLEYIAMNCIVLSCCDISEEFADIPDGDLFVRRVKSKADVRRVIEEFKAYPEREIIERFARFKAACAAQYDWAVSLKPLREAVQARLAAQTETPPQPSIDPAPAAALPA